MLIKVRFFKEGRMVGRAYTYDAGDIPLSVGDKVQLPSKNEGVYSVGIVSEVDVPESEVEAFKDQVKKIVAKVEGV